MESITEDSTRHSWMVEMEELCVTNEALEKGGWGKVRVAKFRGIKVAAKYSVKKSSKLVHEMNRAFQIHHPNLVLFMGACLDEKVIILTELMTKSLRKELEAHPTGFSLNHSICIGLDIARALNYLHLMKPEPFFHQDVSSDNVFLELQAANTWKAKLADCCCKDLKQHNISCDSYGLTHVEPPSYIVLQRADILNFGTLLIEMWTGKEPSSFTCKRLLESIRNDRWYNLISSCINNNNPTAAEVIAQLEKQQYQTADQDFELHKATCPWICPQMRTCLNSQDDLLLRSFQDILNKITLQTFQVLSARALWLEFNTERRLTACIEKLLESAVIQPKLGIVYAKLSKVMSSVEVDKEAKDGCIERKSFYKLLLDQIQHEFERHENDMHIVSMEYAISQASSIDEKRKLQNDLFNRRIHDRNQYFGIVCFLSQLFNLKVVSNCVFHECIRHLLRGSFSEESLECVAALFFISGKYIERHGGKSQMNIYIARIKDLILNGALSARVKFKLMDVLELKKNNWHVDETDKNIDF